MDNSRESITVFGGNGFVGGQFCNDYSDRVIKNRRSDYTVHSKRALNFISTVHNYHVSTNPYLDIDTNLKTLIHLLVSSKENKVKEFNFISSWFVYGNQNRLPVPETAYCDPKGFYSITKRCAEQLVISYCETFGMGWRILRLGNVLGVDDKKVSKKKNALQWLIQELVAGRPIELYDGGSFYRDYIDVRDCSRAINVVCEKGETNSIYNIGSKTSVPWEMFSDYIDFVRSVTGSRSKITSIESRNFHKKVQTKSIVLDSSKLFGLGYTPKYNIYETLKEITEYEQNRHLTRSC